MNRYTPKEKERVRIKWKGQSCFLRTRKGETMIAKVASTLDGKFAKIVAMHNPLAVEFCWETVNRIMLSGKKVFQV